ncbi:MAG: preprotein translocase subunit SecA [Deltaproteobacteria bacterium]|nr:preprotein translocase subunit SecA [Deltaproteobacteria bacterium]
MLSNLINSPPATHVMRPEKAASRRPGILDNIYTGVTGAFLHLLSGRFNRLGAFASRVGSYGEDLPSLNDMELRHETDLIRERLHREGFKIAHVARSFALIREAAARAISKRHFDTQIMGGYVLLKGMIAEMETGEGKTLTATLAAGTAALAGVPVHVLSVNDYLTARDAETMGPVYRALGLTVGCVVHGMTPQARRGAYSCDIAYCTNKEIAFDYLKDWISLEDSRSTMQLQAEHLYGERRKADNLLLRGLFFAIVDEADSILIDEARTPLIISRSSGNNDERLFLKQAMEIALKLDKDIDYYLEKDEKRIYLTDEGRGRIRDMSLSMGPLWAGMVRRQEIVIRALSAMILFKRDEQYLVKDGKVQIIDEFTGRVMADRSYEKGLHQLVEIKEGCEITNRTETIARISYQRFFRRYLHLAGMTGTAREVRGELWNVYGLLTVRIPTYRKMRRKRWQDRIFATEEAKWRAVAERTAELNGKGRPVLVGTRSVAASEKAAGIMDRMGIEYKVLNAKQDKEEAEIISYAGEKGAVTIATNMAGRGTDISLGQGVEELNGLHVVLTERHDAGRIDRQLAGRCGRMGDPGTYEAMLSLEDPILGEKAGALARVLEKVLGERSFISRRIAQRAISRAQKKVERSHARIRKGLLLEDARRGDMLSFSGRQE